MLSRRTPGVERLGFQGRPYDGSRVGHGLERLAEDEGRAAGRSNQAENGPQGGALPRSVGSQETCDPTGLHAEGEVMDGGHCSVAYGEVPYVDDRHDLSLQRSSWLASAGRRRAG